MMDSSGLSYVQGRFLDFYRQHPVELSTVMKDVNLKDLEWAYTTDENQIYRHLRYSGFEVPSENLRANNALGIYHSVSEYDQPSNSKYTEKDITRPRVAIRISSPLKLPNEDQWRDSISIIKTIKQTLESEFPLSFRLLRGAINSFYLVSEPVENPAIHSRISGYINPTQYDTFDVENISDSASASQLSRSIYQFVREQYLDLHEQLESIDLTEEDALDQEDFKEIQKQLTRLDGIGDQKSIQILRDLNKSSPEEITEEKITRTTPDYRTATEQFARAFIDTQWFGNTKDIHLNVLDSHGLVPSMDCLVPNGGFRSYVVEDIDSITRFPIERIPSFFEGNTINISLKEPYITELLTQFDLEEHSENQAVDERLGLLLLSSGLAEKEPED